MGEKNRFKRVLPVIGLAVGAIVAAIVLLPIALPFLIGLAIACLAEPLVRLLQRHSKLPRWLCSGISVTAIYAVLGLLLFILLRRLLYETAAFSRQLPQLLATLAQPAAHLREQLLALAARAPDGFGEALTNWITQFFNSGAGLPERLPSAIFSAASSLLTALPNLLLFLFTAILSSFMLSSELPSLRRQCLRMLPQRWQQRAASILERLKSALGGWLLAQLKLMGVTFAVVSAGLFLLRIDFALLFGALIALIDALPLLGAGTILIPWGLWMCIIGQTNCGIGLFVLYGAAALLRSALEPRLLGKQIGLPPLLTLAALYAGFRLCGVLGMIFFPIGAILLKQLWDHLSHA